MRNVMKLALFAVTSLCLFASTAVAREKKDFTEYLKKITKLVDEYSTDKYFEKEEFTSRKTGEKKKFSDFTELERAVLKIYHGESVGVDLTDAQDKWKDEVKNAEDTPESADEASKKDVEDYAKKLFEIRQKNASKVEDMTKKLFDKYPDKFTTEEKDLFTKKIKAFNDKYKLIKRD